MASTVGVVSHARKGLRAPPSESSAELSPSARGAWCQRQAKAGRPRVYGGRCRVRPVGAWDPRQVLLSFVPRSTPPCEALSARPWSTWQLRCYAPDRLDFVGVDFAPPSKRAKRSKAPTSAAVGVATNSVSRSRPSAKPSKGKPSKRSTRGTK